MLIRIAETTTAQTWSSTRDELQRLHLGTFTGPAGTFLQRTEIHPTPAQDPPPSRSTNPAESTG